MRNTITPHEAVVRIIDYKRNVDLPSGKEVGKVCDHNPCATAAADKVDALVASGRGGELVRVLQGQVVQVPGCEYFEVVIGAGVGDVSAVKEEVA